MNTLKIVLRNWLLIVNGSSDNNLKWALLVLAIVALVLTSIFYIKDKRTGFYICSSLCFLFSPIAFISSNIIAFVLVVIILMAEGDGYYFNWEHPNRKNLQHLLYFISFCVVVITIFNHPFTL